MVSPDYYSALYNLVLIGNSSVGKTSLAARIAGQPFNENCIETIGLDFKIRTVTFRDQRVKLHIWDCSGNLRFLSITTSYLRGAHTIIIVYSCTDRASFEAVPMWLETGHNFSSSGTIYVLAANKADLLTRQVAYEEGKKFADSHKLIYVEFSALTLGNIEPALACLVEALLEVEKRQRDLYLGRA
jgi:small GTP-binding protein